MTTGGQRWRREWSGAAGCAGPRSAREGCGGSLCQEVVRAMNSKLKTNSYTFLAYFCRDEASENFAPVPFVACFHCSWS